MNIDTCSSTFEVLLLYIDNKLLALLIDPSPDNEWWIVVV